MRFASLGSGSRGNSLVVEAGDTKLLLDCGFSTRATIEKLARLAISPEEIGSSPAIIRRVVDLPQPDGPTSTTNSWSAMSRSIPFTAL